MAKAKEGIDLFKHVAQIRKTWDRGQKTIILEGRRFVMRLQTHTYKDPETHETHKEQWISIRPMDGSLTPCASIERRHYGNMRTVR